MIASVYKEEVSQDTDKQAMPFAGKTPERGERKGYRMANAIAFFNSFLSYFLLFVIVAALAVLAFLIGSSLRKQKDRKEAAEKE